MHVVEFKIDASLYAEARSVHDCGHYEWSDQQEQRQLLKQDLEKQMEETRKAMKEAQDGNEVQEERRLKYAELYHQY